MFIYKRRMVYKFAIGSSGYVQRESELEGNGPVTCKAESLDEAVHYFIQELLIPGELTGRQFYVEGVSLPIPDHDVVQIWSNHPDSVNVRINPEEPVEKSWSWSKGRHDPMGLHAEIRFSDLIEKAASNRIQHTGDESSSTALSPLGRNLSSFSDARITLRHSLQTLMFSRLKQTWALQEATEALQAKTDAMSTQLELLSAYTSCIREVVRVHVGDKAPASMPYSVYQNRQYLDKEIAALACFRDFDFKGMEALDKWLVESGQIWKFLPFDKTVLVTRIRKEQKDYGNAWANIQFNEFNFDNIIWIRDGQNVLRVCVDMVFDNAVFPSRASYREAIQFVKDFVWKSRFEKITKKRDWHGKVIEEPALSELLPDAENEKSPYNFSFITTHRFESIAQWEHSAEYKAMEADLLQAVDTHMREMNQKQMKLLIILQGLVDRTRFLSIPAGTDLFNMDAAERWFTLVYDMGALVDPTFRNAIAAYYNGPVQVGDLVVGEAPDTVFEGRRYGDSGWTKRGPGLTLYRVAALNGNKPVVMTHYRARNYPNPYKKKPERYTLPQHLRLDLPEDLAARILDDREWKLNNKWIVPALVKWPELKARFAKGPKNFTPLNVEIE